jgi:anti-sigma factor RsiW
MLYDEVLDAIEPIAAGELTPDDRVAAHLSSCPRCAAALEDARRLERILLGASRAARAGTVHLAHLGRACAALGIWWWAERELT